LSIFFQATRNIVSELFAVSVSSIFTRDFVLLYMRWSEIPHYSFPFGFPLEKNLRDSKETVRNSVTAESTGRQILYASVWMQIHHSFCMVRFMA